MTYEQAELDYLDQPGRGLVDQWQNTSRPRMLRPECMISRMASDMYVKNVIQMGIVQSVVHIIRVQMWELNECTFSPVFRFRSFLRTDWQVSQNVCVSIYLPNWNKTLRQVWQVCGTLSVYVIIFPLIYSYPFGKNDKQSMTFIVFVSHNVSSSFRYSEQVSFKLAIHVFILSCA